MVWITTLVEFVTVIVRVEVVAAADGLEALAMEVSRLVFPAEAEVIPGKATEPEVDTGVRVIVSVLVAESVRAVLMLELGEAAVAGVKDCVGAASVLVLELDGNAVHPNPRQVEVEGPLVSDDGVSVTVMVVAAQVPL